MLPTGYCTTTHTVDDTGLLSICPSTLCLHFFSAQKSSLKLQLLIFFLRELPFSFYRLYEQVLLTLFFYNLFVNLQTVGNSEKQLEVTVFKSLLLNVVNKLNQLILIKKKSGCYVNYVPLMLI